MTNLSDIVNIGNWLFSVARNKITDSYRKKKTERLEDFIYKNEEDIYTIKNILLMDSDKNTELKLFQDDIWNELLKALDELPEKQRFVYIENEFNDKTLQEIAEELDENIKTIISRKRYAVKHLRLKLRQLYNDLKNI